MSDLVHTALHYCAVVKNDRTLDTTFKHASSEMNELAIEIKRHNEGEEPGDDGIIGEAVDVIACMIDLIHMVNPNIESHQVAAVMVKKLDKWKRLYDKGTTETE